MHRLELEVKESLIDEGTEAARAGKALSANPHQSLSPEYEAWRAGWFRHVNAEQERRESLYA